MFRTTGTRAAAIAVCLPTALAVAGVQASTPTLRHTTAPFIGHTLTLEVEGAVPNASIDLYFSREAGTYSTPYGLLELRNRLRLLAHGATDAAGAWSFDFAVPLDENWAETGAHFQALVDDPMAPAGRVFSSAVHARFLGPRVYARHTESGGGMFVLSAVTDAVVAHVDFGASGNWNGYQHEGKPVFDATFSRGAGMSAGNELVFFDPFFGGVLSRVAFASDCSGTVFTDSSRRNVFVLELASASSPARIHAIDFATAAPTVHLDLPNSVEPLWCLGHAASEVFVAEHEADGSTAIRWVGLVPLTDRGSAQIGTPGSNSFTDYDGTRTILLPMIYAAGQVFVSTFGPGNPFFQGSLTRCRASPGGIGTAITDLGPSRFYQLAAVPSVDRVLAGWGRTDGGPFFEPVEFPLFEPGALTTDLRPPYEFIAPPQGSISFYIRDMVPDEAKAWIVAEQDWQHSDILHRLDMKTHVWTEYPHSWLYGPSDAELLKDAQNHELWVSNQGVEPPVDIDPEILIVDELHGTSRHISLEHTAQVLHAVPLP